MSVPLKKTPKPSRSIRYLLSGDRTLQRLSLRKISKQANTVKHSTRSKRSRSTERAKDSFSFPSAISSRGIVVAVILALATAALIAARQPAHRGSAASVAALTDADAPSQEMAKVPLVETKKTGAPKASMTAAAKTSPVDPGKRKKSPVESVKASAIEPANTQFVESTAKTNVPELATATITGCLEGDSQTFWLKDASGADAPKTRSWRSGFLKKRTPPIDLVAANNTLQLTNYVGQRITATGTLVNREMRVRSLRRVASSCS